MELLTQPKRTPLQPTEICNPSRSHFSPDFTHDLRLIDIVFNHLQLQETRHKSPVTTNVATIMAKILGNCNFFMKTTILLLSLNQGINFKQLLKGLQHCLLFNINAYTSLLNHFFITLRKKEMQITKLFYLNIDFTNKICKDNLCKAISMRM